MEKEQNKTNKADLMGGQINPLKNFENELKTIEPNLNDTKIKQILSLFTRKIEHQEISIQSGPLPAPEILAQYDKIVLGAADRIICMAEKQSNHRHDIEKTVILSNTKMANKGITFAFIIVMVSIIGGMILIYLDKNVYGLTSIITALLSAVGVFIYGKATQDITLKDKKKKLEEISQK